MKAASAVNKPPAAGRRSSRAAANTPKNYREIESDGSQSEFELFKATLHDLSDDIYLFCSSKMIFTVKKKNYLTHRNEYISD